MHRAGRPVSAKPHSRDARTTGDMSDTRSMDGGEKPRDMLIKHSPNQQNKHSENSRGISLDTNRCIERFSYDLEKWFR